MTTKSPKTTKATGDAIVGTGLDGDATPGSARGGTGVTKAKPAKRTTPNPEGRQRRAVAEGDAKTERKARTDTKQAKLIAMLEARDGATVEEIAAAFGWQAHTVRGALYGALRKKLGLDVTSEKVEGKGRVYRIGS